MCALFISLWFFSPAINGWKNYEEVQEVCTTRAFHWNTNMCNFHRKWLNWPYNRGIAAKLLMLGRSIVMLSQYKLEYLCVSYCLFLLVILYVRGSILEYLSVCTFFFCCWSVCMNMVLLHPTTICSKYVTHYHHLIRGRWEAVPDSDVTHVEIKGSDLILGKRCLSVRFLV